MCMHEAYSMNMTGRRTPIWVSRVQSAPTEVQDKLPTLFTTQHPTDMSLLVHGFLNLHIAVAAQRHGKTGAICFSHEEGSMNARQRPDDESHQRNISEMFLDFADPIMETLPEDGNAAQMEHALKIAYTMWNAMVLVRGQRRPAHPRPPPRRGGAAPRGHHPDQRPHRAQTDIVRK